MGTKIIVLSDEMLSRVYQGLGELQAKVSYEVITSIESQVKLSSDDVSAYVSLVEASMQPYVSKSKEVEQMP